MSQGMAIETAGLTKRYGLIEAVRGLDLRVPAGSICGLLGPNGAGKTTTLKMLVGLTRPSGGTGYVLGCRIDDRNESVAIRRRTGFVTEGKELFEYMTVAESIRFTSAFFPSWKPDVVSRCLDRFGLSTTERVAALSKGMRGRLYLLLVLARGADVLLLDEPTDGLDPAAIEAFLQLLVGLVAESGATVLLSSHRLAEIEQVADRIAILNRGRIVLNDSLDALQSRYHRLHLVFETDIPDAALALTRTFSGSSEGRTLSLLVSGDVDAVVEQARAWRPLATDVAPVTLKEILLETTKGQTA
jgi:ABC-2 type transport system ATP-binding protein